MRPAASSNSRTVSSPRISALRRCSAGTASASRGSPSCATDAATSPCTIASPLSIRTAKRGHALAEHEQQAGADAVHRLAEHGLAAGRGLAERAHDARHAPRPRGTGCGCGSSPRPAACPAFPGALAGPSRRSVKHARRRDGSQQRVRKIHSVPVSVCDVGPRDGLQNDKVTLEPATRAELCTRLAATGLQRIEAASFVHPKLVPQMAGAEEVFANLPPNGDDLRQPGAQPQGPRAGADDVARTRSTSPTRSRRRSPSATRTRPSRRPRRPPRTSSSGTELKVDGDDQRRVRLPVRGPRRPGPGDRARAPDGRGGSGRGDPGRHDRRRRAEAGRANSCPRALEGGKPVGLHLHNTRNTGYANAIAGLEHGATIFDASVGGLGGCPFAPRATGNIATEDLIYLLENEGVETGVDLDALIGVAEWLSDAWTASYPASCSARATSRSGITSP